MNNRTPERISAESVKSAFMADFIALLEKHGVTFSLETHIRGYSDYSASAEIHSYTKFDDDGNEIREYVEFCLPEYLP